MSSTELPHGTLVDPSKLPPPTGTGTESGTKSNGTPSITLPDFTKNNIRVYIKAFETDLTATAATVPTEMPDSFVYDVEFDTVLNVNNDMFQFKVDDTQPEKLTIQCQPVTDWDSFRFNVAESVYVGAGTGKTAYFSLTSGFSTAYLMDEYISYLAFQLLGSQYLAGAFDNIPELQASIMDKDVNGNQDTSVKANINTALASRTIEIDNYYHSHRDASGNIHTNDNALDDSALSQVFYSVLKNHPDRIYSAQQGVNNGLLQPGDILELKFVVNTPTVHQSILDIKSSASAPSARTYKVNIHISSAGK